MTAVYHDQSYGSDIKTIVVDFGYTFDIPPDIERLEVVDETLGSTRAFTLTINQIWTSSMAITIQRTDLRQGWSTVLKLLWYVTIFRIHVGGTCWWYMLVVHVGLYMLVVHVGLYMLVCTRCVTASTDPMIHRQGQITGGVEIVSTLFFPSLYV
jgi:hypothetical protein